MPIFACDIDDVIVDLVQSIFEYTSSTHGIHARYEDFLDFNFMGAFGGITVEECDALLDKYFASDNFLNIKPRTDAVIGLNSLKFSGCEAMALTSRHDIIRDHSRLWLRNTFPGVFSRVLFSNNIHTVRASGRPKAEVLEEIKADFFAEDSRQYALDAADVVRFVYMFRHPWNRGLILPKNVIEVDTWYEVTAHVRSQIM